REISQAVYAHDLESPVRQAVLTFRRRQELQRHSISDSPAVLCRQISPYKRSVRRSLCGFKLILRELEDLRKNRVDPSHIHRTYRDSVARLSIVAPYKVVVRHTLHARHTLNGT